MLKPRGLFFVSTVENAVPQTQAIILVVGADDIITIYEIGDANVAAAVSSDPAGATSARRSTMKLLLLIGAENWGCRMGRSREGAH
ncbi:MAG: hypothetical protein WBD71_18690 [Xanthobacteraceae bacterium]